jgi:hypothetical protein
LPPGLSGWTDHSAFKAASESAGLGAAVLPIGKAVDLALLPTPSVRYALPPEKPGASVSNGGLVGFAVDRPGTYRVALGSAAWIDVVRDGAAAASIAHGHGPACSGIRKMVEFALEPGSYVLQIAGSESPNVRLLITPLP